MTQDQSDHPQDEPRKAEPKPDPKAAVESEAEKPDQQPEGKEPGPKKERGSKNVPGFEGTNIYAKRVVVAGSYEEMRDRASGEMRYLGIEAKAFSFRHAEKVPEQKERELASYYHPNDETIYSLRAVLEERHIVVLTGEPEQGKTATAQFLGQLLRSVQNRPFAESRMVAPLAQNVRIAFEGVIENKKRFGGKLLIFRDVFSTRNPNVLSFFTLMDRHRAEAYSEKLRKNGIFLLFTTDTTSIDKKFHDNLSNLNLLQELPAMTPAQLKMALALRLKQFAQSRGLDETETNSILNPGECTLLLERLRTMPRIDRFVENYLLQLKNGQVDFNEAVSRFENLDRWFQRELAEDFDAWCFAFALALCQCTREPEGVPWFQFEYFRRAFSRSLSAEFDLPGKKKPAFKDSISEQSLVQLCRAEIREDPVTGAHCVRFLDDRYPDMLWKSFLKSNRKLFTSVIGQLKKMATEVDPGVRRRAAQILGRIGEIDPIRLTLSLMDKWISTREYRQMATVGYLYEGIHASKNDRYENAFLKELAGLAIEEDKPEIWTAIAAYQRVGVHNLPLAMQRYREIAERKLVGSIEDTKRIDRILSRVEAVLDQSSPETIEHAALDIYSGALSDAARRIYDDDGPFLFAIQHSVVTLCLECGLSPVLQELSKWMESGQKALSYVVTLIFLMEGGIVETYEGRRGEFQNMDDTTDSQASDCNLLVFSIASDESSVQQMADFIAGVFAGFSNFLTPRYRRFLRDVLFWHLKKWAEDSLPIKRCRDAMEQLFADLLTGPNVELSERFSGFIQADSDFTKKDKPLYQFAIAVFARATAAAAQRRSLILA